MIGPNSLSMWSGAYSGHGPTNHADLLPRNGAGGKFSILGDYLYRDFASFGFDGGLWGAAFFLLRSTLSRISSLAYMLM